MTNNVTYLGIDLAKNPWYKENQIWIGRKVSEVVNPDDISKIILIEAVTSAPADLDIKNIHSFLKNDSVFENNPEPFEMRDNYIWEALLVTRKGEYFLFRANNEWICIVNENGHGFIRRRDD